VGALIWNLVQQPRTMGAIRDALLDEYDVDPERCESVLRAFLTELASAGLVEVTDAQRR
ncbi:MAG: PqqD family protein, partial [Candidatus Rokuibacteriota bacterium]